jgi:hypothetical protein
MVAYFPLVMGDALSLWLNNLSAGSITSWAYLSQAFTSNFQAMYNRPGNTFDLRRVTMKPGEWLWDSPQDSQGSCQSAEQGDYKRSIYLYTLATQTLTMIKLENN